MLTGIHFLLTYTCTSECDHCFVYASPEAEGTFTLRQLRDALDEADKIGTIESMYFEGGEPFLFYPLMIEGIRITREMGFEVGVVSNAYWATSVDDAKLWLGPLAELKVSELSLSDDSFHHDQEKESPAKLALKAAKKLGIPANTICIDKPTMKSGIDMEHDKGAPVVGGGVMFRGRAADKLIEGLPRRPWQDFTECPYEELKDPLRVHIDSFGNVHICQGLSIGNMWKTPLSKLIKDYHADSHPICGPLLKGGPALLAKQYNIETEDGYVDACHLCYSARAKLIDRFPECLAPRQIYGLE